MGEFVIQLKFTGVTEAQAATIKSTIQGAQLPTGVTMQVAGSSYTSGV